MDIRQKKSLEAVKKFRLLDDSFMTIVFDHNVKATELLLRVILNRKDLKVTETVAQRYYKNPASDGHSIRLDIEAKDDAGKCYDIEVQQDPEGAIPQRARFYSSMIDVRMLKAGQEQASLCII